MTPKKPDSPFAKLAELREQLPAGAPPPAAPPAAKPKGPSVPRAVVRFERKHRGGKEVTLVEKLALPPSQLALWCKELKQALGCGGTVDGDVIILQGDARQRLPALLAARGVGKVTVAG